MFVRPGIYFTLGVWGTRRGPSLPLPYHPVIKNSSDRGQIMKAGKVDNNNDNTKYGSKVVTNVFDNTVNYNSH